MSRVSVWWVVIAMVSMSAPAYADRAFAPSETLEAGTVEVGAGVSSQRRELRLQSLTGDETTVSRSSDSEVFARAWLSDRIWLGASQAAFFARSARDAAGEIPVDTAGMSVLSLSGGGLGQLGSLTLGGDLELALPNGTGFDLGRVDATARAIAGLPGYGDGQVFALADYTARFGDDFTDVPDSVGATAGYHQRLGAASLLASVRVERLVESTAFEDAFTTLRTSASAGYEVAGDLTWLVTIEAAWAREHGVGAGASGRGQELSARTALVYAWDTGDLAGGATQPADPALIRVADVAGGEPVATALKKRVPALRLATLEAERDAGGATGTMRVTLEIDSQGKVASSDVVDATGVQSLADAVAGYWRSASLPELTAPSKVEFTIAFVRTQSSHRDQTRRR